MTYRNRKTKKRVAPCLYNRHYFLNECGGHDVYASTKGSRLDERLFIIFQMCKISSPLRVLDLGCGRGELIYHACLLGARVWGVDVSPDALHISRETLSGLPWGKTPSWGLCRGNSIRLPFRDCSFDRVILSDILEHLVPGELEATVREVWRVISPQGIVVLHTFPNRWFYDVFYPLKRRFIDKPKGRAGPRDPRSAIEKELHVNELSPYELWRCLRPLFRVNIWCAHRSRWDPDTGRFRMPLGPFSIFTEPEIWAVAWPQKGPRGH